MPTATDIRHPFSPLVFTGADRSVHAYTFDRHLFKVSTKNLTENICKPEEISQKGFSMKQVFCKMTKEKLNKDQTQEPKNLQIKYSEF